MFYIAAAAVTLFIIFCGREKKPVKTAAAAVFTGTASLIAAHFNGFAFGVRRNTLCAASGVMDFEQLTVN